MFEIRCMGCSAVQTKDSGQWWFLNDYHGLYGRFCPQCFDDAAHRQIDVAGKLEWVPDHPERYKALIGGQK